MSYLNNNDDEFLAQLFSETNGFFFEKQIILDILLDKIKSDRNRNFEELNVHSIYCMDFDVNKLDISKYKDKDIVIIQESKTGEIYDFGIIVGNSVKLYQVSIDKTEDDLIKLNKNKIEVDCNYMQNKCLNNLGNYENFSFGIITNKLNFSKYTELIKQKAIQKEEKKIKSLENKISKTSYYLMKEHCKKNNYELLIYDMKEKKILIENDSSELIDYDLYKFYNKNKLNIPKLEKIYKTKSKKISLKYFNKDDFINKIDETQLFSKLEKNDNENSLNIVGKFKYTNELLDINEIEEDDYFLYISGKITNKDNKLEILKYKKEEIIN